MRARTARSPSSRSTAGPSVLVAGNTTSQVNVGTGTGGRGSGSPSHTAALARRSCSYCQDEEYRQCQEAGWAEEEELAA